MQKLCYVLVKNTFFYCYKHIIADVLEAQTKQRNAEFSNQLQFAISREFSSNEFGFVFINWLGVCL